MAFIAKTFGVNALRRDQLITRGPRFQICFDANAAELVNQSAGNTKNQYRQGQKEISLFGGNNAFGEANLSGAAKKLNSSSNLGLNVPAAAGRYELQRCKVDSVSLGIMPGRRVAAVRWEGVAEGITYVNSSVQSFKNEINEFGIASQSTARNAISSIPTNPGIALPGNSGGNTQ